MTIVYGSWQWVIPQQILHTIGIHIILVVSSTCNNHIVFAICAHTNSNYSGSIIES